MVSKEDHLEIQRRAIGLGKELDSLQEELNNMKQKEKLRKVQENHDLLENRLFHGHGVKFFLPRSPPLPFPHPPMRHFTRHAIFVVMLLTNPETIKIPVDIPIPLPII